jgi:hypothetical protein
VTCTLLQNTSLRPNCNFGTTAQPGGVTLDGQRIVNERMYVVVTDMDLFVLPQNLAILNPHIIAGPGQYSVG